MLHLNPIDVDNVYPWHQIVYYMIDSRESTTDESRSDVIDEYAVSIYTILVYISQYTDEGDIGTRAKEVIYTLFSKCYDNTTNTWMFTKKMSETINAICRYKKLNDYLVEKFKQDGIQINFDKLCTSAFTGTASPVPTPFVTASILPQQASFDEQSTASYSQPSSYPVVTARSREVIELPGGRVLPYDNGSSIPLSPGQRSEKEIREELQYREQQQAKPQAPRRNFFRRGGKMKSRKQKKSAKKSARKSARKCKKKNKKMLKLY